MNKKQKIKKLQDNFNAMRNIIEIVLMERVIGTKKISIVSDKELSDMAKEYGVDNTIFNHKFNL